MERLKSDIFHSIPAVQLLRKEMTATRTKWKYQPFESFWVIDLYPVELQNGEAR